MYGLSAGDFVWICFARQDLKNEPGGLQRTNNGAPSGHLWVPTCRCVPGKPRQTCSFSCVRMEIMRARELRSAASMAKSPRAASARTASMHQQPSHSSTQPSTTSTSIVAAT